MENKKAASGSKRAIALAYTPAFADNRKRREPLPGPIYDAIVVGLFIVFGVAYFV